MELTAYEETVAVVLKIWLMAMCPRGPHELFHPQGLCQLHGARDG